MKILNNLKFLALTLIIFAGSVFCVSADSTYVVKKGDTLYSISRKYQLTVPELRAANNLSESEVLKEGAKLVIPSADISNAAALSTTQKAEKTESPVVNSAPSGTSSKGTYTVKAGDTLYGIAKKHNIKLAELLAINNLDNSSTIKVGQKIVVPGAVTVENKPSSSNTKIAATPASNDNTGIAWPLSNPGVKNINGKVSGVELFGKDGEAVKVVREGTVMYTGVYRGFGEVVFVQSKTGLIYSYSGLTKVSAKKGDYVVAGTEIGKIGKGNDASMKFMVFQNGKPVNPSKAPRG